MISREKAIAAAEEIIATERRRLNEIQNAGAPRVPAFLRVPGLSFLEPRHQAALLRRAEKNVEAKWSYRLWCLALIAGISVTWYVARDSEFTFGPLWVLAPVFGVFLLRRLFVRSELRALAAAPGSREASQSEANHL